jgi:hypothetical protein
MPMMNYREKVKEAAVPLGALVFVACMAYLQTAIVDNQWQTPLTHFENRNKGLVDHRHKTVSYAEFNSRHTIKLQGQELVDIATVGGPRQPPITTRRQATSKQRLLWEEHFGTTI